jgi:hypothetical protein
MHGTLAAAPIHLRRFQVIKIYLAVLSATRVVSCSPDIRNAAS